PTSRLGRRDVAEGAKSAGTPPMPIAAQRRPRISAVIVFYTTPVDEAFRHPGVASVSVDIAVPAFRLLREG
ncbi:hypothetical protein, partial [Acinetobacter baumannii]|uniref:hypothetical protein n=1 Tax=Acinetobacter baumannii TaxID=470 RepID=UPI0031F465F3